MKKTLLFVLGTRPEAIKLAPLIVKSQADSRFRTLVCSTGQHRDMVQNIFSAFQIKPDFDLEVMQAGQTLIDVSSRVLAGLQNLLSQEKVDALVVQGDTTSCFMTGLAGFYLKIPVFHVEAGLRSGDINSPFPEEFNRKATGLLASLHLAPTEMARKNLLTEHVQENTIVVTGNTGIDALLAIKAKIDSQPEFKSKLEKHFGFLNPAKKLILTTLHRRESFGPTMNQIMEGLKTLSQRNDVEILMPVHPNPNVRKSLTDVFQTSVDSLETPTQISPSFWLCQPQDYFNFVYLMSRAHLIITDSGGVQEEAPSFGKPILVARENTERPEAILAGTSRLIPLTAQAFAATATELLNDQALYAKMAKAQNPFGDGHASEKILEAIQNYFKTNA